MQPSLGPRGDSVCIAPETLLPAPPGRAAGSGVSRHLLGIRNLLENSEENLSHGASLSFPRAPLRRLPARSRRPRGSRCTASLPHRRLPRSARPHATACRRHHLAAAGHRGGRRTGEQAPLRGGRAPRRGAPGESRLP